MSSSLLDETLRPAEEAADDEGLTFEGASFGGADSLEVRHQHISHAMPCSAVLGFLERSEKRSVTP